MIRQSGAEVRSDPDGLASTTEVFRGFYADMVSTGTLRTSSGFNVNRLYLARHFLYPSLLAYSVRIKEVPGVINGELTIEYRGLDPALSYPPPPIATTEESSSVEPLQAHPLFDTEQMAGTPADPENGAIFQDAAGNTNPPAPEQTGTFDPTTATFIGWSADSDFAGYNEYEPPCVVFRITYTSFNLPDLSATGTFSNPPCATPDIPDGTGWWFVGGSSEDNAGIYRNVLSWKSKVLDDASQVIYGG